MQSEIRWMNLSRTSRYISDATRVLFHHDKIFGAFSLKMFNLRSTSARTSRKFADENQARVITILEAKSKEDI